MVRHANPIEIRDEAVLAKLNAIVAAGRNPRPALTEIGRTLKTYVQLGFRQSQDPYGRPWAPLKSRKGQPLKDTGRLAASITDQVTDDSVTVGTNVQYAAPHQFGVDKQVKVKRHPRLVLQVFGRKLPFGVYATVKAHQRPMKLPARPFFPNAAEGFPDTWRASVLGILARHLVEPGNAGASA
jgi:phage virion morphogenesis protein